MKHILILLPLFLATALHAKPENTTPKKSDARSDASSDATAGRNLTAEQVSDLEAAVAKNPEDLSARTKLLGYYFMVRYTAADTRVPYRKHVLWIIKNQPESEIAGTPYCSLDAITDADGYNEAKQLWSDQTRANPKNATILGRAAQFLLLHDRDKAEQLLREAQKLEPKEPKWSDSLGQLLALSQTKEGAAQALVEYEKAQAADTSEMTKFYRLDQLAKAAFAAGDLAKASQYADECLAAAKKHPKDWNYGNAVHHGNNILGQVALKQGKVKEADALLLKAGQTPGSPQLNSFGPNMELAQQLLKAGEKDTVLQYFDSCRKFWEMGGERLDEWTKQVKAGEMPQFAGNLVY